MSDVWICVKLQNFILQVCLCGGFLLQVNVHAKNKQQRLDKHPQAAPSPPLNYWIPLVTWKKSTFPKLTFFSPPPSSIKPYIYITWIYSPSEKISFKW